MISRRPAETMEECVSSTLPKIEVIFDPIKVKKRETREYRTSEKNRHCIDYRIIFKYSVQ